jgi:hypothetical protein
VKLCDFLIAGLRPAPACPYATNAGYPNTTSDSPGMPLAATSEGNPIPMGEGAEAFGATMYLLWDPALPVGCPTASTIQTIDPVTHKPTITQTASQCSSVPVPLGYVNWGFCGDAINTVPSQNNTYQQWMLSCGGPTPVQPTVQSSSSYPTWTGTVQNGQ